MIVFSRARNSCLEVNPVSVGVSPFSSNIPSCKEKAVPQTVHRCARSARSPEKDSDNTGAPAGGRMLAVGVRIISAGGVSVVVAVRVGVMVAVSLGGGMSVSVGANVRVSEG